MRFSSKKSACTKSRKMAFAVQKFLWQMHFAQKHHSRPKPSQKSAACSKNKTVHIFPQIWMFFHHSASFPELVTTEMLLTPKWAARPNSHWVIAHVHHMHRSVYFHIPSREFQIVSGSLKDTHFEFLQLPPCCQQSSWDTFFSEGITGLGMSTLKCGLCESGAAVCAFFVLFAGLSELLRNLLSGYLCASRTGLGCMLHKKDGELGCKRAWARMFEVLLCAFWC